MLLRSTLIEREPLYRQQETVSTFAPAAFGLSTEQAQRLGDDAVGRAPSIGSSMPVAQRC